MPSFALTATALSLTIYFAAMWRGGGPERGGAAILFIAFLVDEIYHAVTGPPQFSRVDPMWMAIDLFSFIAFTVLAVRANRLWPMIVASLQLFAVIGHVAMLIRTGYSGMQRAYWAMTEPPVLATVITLLVALLLHIRRERRLGEYPDWRQA